MKHTELTLRNFTGLAVADFLIGSVTVGFGAIDLIMIAPKGGIHVAAVGQADLIVMGLFAFFLGIVDVFAGRVAQAEGSDRTLRRLPNLAAALALSMAAAAVVAALAAQAIRPVLELTGQDPALIPLVDDYVSLRLYSVALVIGYIAVNAACRICGLKNATVTILVGGFVANALLNWLLLYGPLQSLPASPEQAVAAATAVAQGLMLLASLAVLTVELRRRDGRLGPLAGADVLPGFWSMTRTAAGIGARHLNDYAGSVVPLLFVGTLGAASVAAFAVGAKIYTLFCRVPQSCVSSAFVYYGYEVGRARTPADLRRSAHVLLRWAAIPTAVATVLVLAASPWLVRVFGGAGLDRGLAVAMLLAFMVTVPLYLFEAAYGEILTVHQRGALLSASSTVTTWLIMIPVAAFGIFVLHSAPLAIGLGGLLSTAALVWVFRRALRRDHWAADAPMPMEAAR